MEIKIMITINRGKRDLLKERAKKYGIIPSVVTVYGILRMLDMLDGKRVSDVDRNFAMLAMDEYRPYENETDICCTSISAPCYITTRTDLSKRLSVHGFRLVSTCKAFFNLLLKCDIDSIPTYSHYDGFVFHYIKSTKVLSLKNKPINTELHLSEPVYDELKYIAEQSEISVYRMIARAIDTLIAIEFDRDVYIENSDIIHENMLSYNKKVTGITGRSGFRFNMRKLDRGVRILVLLEKYGIPGISELLHRIVRFILLSHSGEISLKRVRVIDDSNYNETRMIRNEFRKEALYASTR